MAHEIEHEKIALVAFLRIDDARGYDTSDRKNPFIQKLNDRIVVDVESSMLNAGSSAPC